MVVLNVKCFILITFFCGLVTGRRTKTKKAKKQTLRTEACTTPGCQISINCDNEICATGQCQGENCNALCEDPRTCSSYTMLFNVVVSKCDTYCNVSCSGSACRADVRGTFGESECSGPGCSAFANGISSGSLCTGAKCLGRSEGVNNDVACYGESCHSECSGVDCDSACTGVSCSCSCKGVSCYAGCEGANCASTCSGVNCKSKCVGKSCISSCHGSKCLSECVGEGCEHKCKGTKCETTRGAIEKPAPPAPPPQKQEVPAPQPPPQNVKRGYNYNYLKRGLKRRGWPDFLNMGSEHFRCSGIFCFHEDLAQDINQPTRNEDNKKNLAYLMGNTTQSRRKRNRIF